MLFSKFFDLLLQGEKDRGYEDNYPRGLVPHRIVRTKLAVHLECCLSLGDYSEGAIALSSHDEIAMEFAFCECGFPDRASTQSPSRCVSP
jgi:hypothetical protein